MSCMKLEGSQMTSAFAELFKHNLWANLRVLDLCSTLGHDMQDATAVGTYGSIRDTFLHLIAAEGRYVALLNNREPDRAFGERTSFPGWDELRARAQKSGQELIDIADDFDSSRVLRGVRNGKAYQLPAVVPMLQAINHATEHRAHVATILTQHGVEPPTLDGWKYGEEELGAS